MSADPIATPRLDLVPATAASVRAALGGPDALAACLGAAVPVTWPPGYVAAPAAIDAPGTGL